MSPQRQPRLGSDTFRLPTLELAQELLGKLLVRCIDGKRRSGWIVETEAYLHQDDPASHSSRGLGKKNRSMYLPSGHLYVYPIHAKYCMNVVTEGRGLGAAVLIRALEPFEDHEGLRASRNKDQPREWMRGPAKACQALHVDRELDGVSLVDSEDIWIENSVVIHRESVRCSSRIGISTATDKPWRFFVDGNRFVSGFARQHSRRPKDSLFEKYCQENATSK